jgi:1-deoxy-D-xylulose-5-phosphate synthase
MVGSALEAASELSQQGISATVVNCRFLKPYDRQLLARLLDAHDAVLTIEEGTQVNGFGAFLAREILDDPELRFPSRFGTMGIPDRFVEHGSREILLAEAGLDVPGIVGRAWALLGREAPISTEGDIPGARESA